MHKLLLIALLLTGCSSIEPTDSDSDADANSTINGVVGGKTNAEKIYNAESLCMQKGEFKDVSEYNACVDKALGNNQRAKAILAQRIARAKTDPSSHGLSDADRMCERYGHVIGTEEYDVCVDYAKENPANANNPSSAGIVPKR